MSIFYANQKDITRISPCHEITCNLQNQHNLVKFTVQKKTQVVCVLQKFYKLNKTRVLQLNLYIKSRLQQRQYLCHYFDWFNVNEDFFRESVPLELNLLSWSCCILTTSVVQLFILWAPDETIPVSIPSRTKMGNEVFLNYFGTVWSGPGHIVIIWYFINIIYLNV